MEIGPVNGIRAISLLSVQRSENAAPPIFEIDASARADDEAYSSSSQTPDRGLEDGEFDFPMRRPIGVGKPCRPRRGEEQALACLHDVQSALSKSTLMA